MVAETRRRIPQLTDFEEGSVIRSLYESFAYELAILYEQMDSVYQAGFIDTATGAALDRVVAVLGIKRNEPDFATGEVTFQRDPGSKETITIPLGTLVTTDKNAYLTTEEGKLPEKINSITVKIQASERGKEMSTEAETITIMPRPVSGIKSVHNPNPIRFLGRDRETDEELRQRAKNALLGSGRASITSIENALLGMSGVHSVHIQENINKPEYGVIEVYIDTPNFQKNRQQLQARIDQIRAAGIYAILKPADKIEINAALQIDIDIIDAQERQHIETQGRKIVTQFINQLQMGQPLLFSQMTREILQLKRINDLLDFKITTSQHKTYTPQHKRIDVTYSQRLVPARIIVASETKDLPIYIQIQLIFPDARDGIKIAKQIPTLINQISLKDFFNKAPNDQLEWTIAFNDEINHQIQNFFQQLTTATQKLKTELAASLDQPIQAIFIKAVKEYFNSAGTKTITQLQQQLKNTLAQKPPEQLREALKLTLEHKLTAFLDEQTKHFPEMKEIFEQRLTETYRQKSSQNQQWRDQEISKRNQAYQDELEIERWKLNHKKQTPDSYNTKLVQMRAALKQDQEQLIQTFENLQQQLETNREEGLKSLKSLTDKLKQTSKTLVSQQILNPDTLTNILKETGQLSAYDFRLTMIEGAFQNEIKILREVSDIQPSFVENAVIGMIFIYSDRLELRGQLKLTLPLTATEDEKERLKNTITQSIKDYLTLLKPKEPVDLTKIRNIAAAQENVLQINFKPEDCHLMLGETILTDRNKEQRLRIESFEKVFLSENFV
ncbi:MAG: baseplate J/gp47 family protein, partial [Pseudomonadota bacterium]